MHPLDPVPEGPSSQYFKTLVPNNIKGMVFGTRVLKYWVLMLFGTRVLKYWLLGPSGCLLIPEGQNREAVCQALDGESPWASQEGGVRHPAESIPWGSKYIKITYFAAQSI